MWRQLRLVLACRVLIAMMLVRSVLVSHRLHRPPYPVMMLLPAPLLLLLAMWLRLRTRRLHFLVLWLRIRLSR